MNCGASMAHILTAHPGLGNFLLWSFGILFVGVVVLAVASARTRRKANRQRNAEHGQGRRGHAAVARRRKSGHR